MSSILDALNKLENEKAIASREAERSDTDPVSIANELVGRSVMRDRVTLRVTPIALLVSVGALVVALIAITFVVAMMLARSPGRTDTPAVPSLAAAPANIPPAAPPAPELVPKAETPPVESTTNLVPASAPTPVAAQPSTPSAPAPSAESPKPTVEKSEPPAPKVETPVAQPDVETASKPETTSESAIVSPPADESQSAAKAPAPAPRPRTRIAAQPVTTETVPARPLPGAATETIQNAEVKLDLLPILTPQDQMRFGFIRLKVNMVKPSGDTNPQGSAILTLEEDSGNGDPVVNRMPFYEGQRLQQSTLRLFKVGPDRVGIEDIRSGEQYQLPI